MRILEVFQATAVDKNRDNILLAKINSCALMLWNLSVAMRNGKKTNSLVNAKGMGLVSSNVQSFVICKKIPRSLRTKGLFI